MIKFFFKLINSESFGLYRKFQIEKRQDFLQCILYGNICVRSREKEAGLLVE